MKASEFRGVTVRRGQGECFNVYTLQRRSRCMFGQSYNKIKGCKFIGVYVTNKVNNKQQEKDKMAFHVKHNAHLNCTHLYFIIADWTTKHHKKDSKTDANTRA